MNRLEAIVQASVRTVRDLGIERWSMDRVARGTPCAKGLLVHHFGTRAGLLAETALQIAAVRSSQRVAALRPSAGPPELEALWTVIAEDGANGISRAVFALAAQGYPTAAADDPIKLQLAAARCLGIPPDAMAGPTALFAMVEGIEFQLVSGRGPREVKAAFDRLWVTMIEA